MVEGVVVIDVVNCIVLVNIVFLCIIGYESLEVIGLMMVFFKFGCYDV